jgi:DNA repair exonuclease SbcCD ATPase subunit
MDLRRRELEFSNSFSNSIAKVKEETADTIVRLQAQVEGKELIESSNAELRSRITSMQRDQESLVSRHDVEQVRKDEHIHALEKTIETQKQAIKNMNEKIHELRNQKEKLSDEKLEVAQDLQLQIGALRAKEETLDKTVIELTGIVESQKVDYLAQVQSLQLMIEELEREGPLSRAIEALEKTEIMADVRLRVGDLKARNQRLQQENLKLAFHMDATSLKLKKMETRKEDTKELKAEFARMKEELDLFQSPKFDDVQNENIMLRERLKFIDKELRQDERYCLVEEANEWYKQSSVGPKITSLSFSTLSGGCDNLIAEDKKSTPQNCNTVKDVMVKESSKQNQGSIDEDKWL